MTKPDTGIDELRRRAHDTHIGPPSGAIDWDDYMAGMDIVLDLLEDETCSYAPQTPPQPAGSRVHLYIAGPMHGRELYNFPTFDSARNWLLDDGYKVTSPADLDRRAGYDPAYDGMDLPEGFMAQTMRRDIYALLKVDGVALLPGWEKSKGTAIELTVARALGLDVWELGHDPLRETERGGIYWTELLPLDELEQERRQYRAQNPMPPRMASGGIVPKGVTYQLTVDDTPLLRRLGHESIPPLWPTDETNPKDRYGDAKPPLHLVPAPLAIFVSKVMQLGAKKYGAFNWRKKKVKASVYVGAAQRHLAAYFDGEDVDPESGQPHPAHVAACMGILLDAKATGNLIDDRPTVGAAAALLADLTEATS